MNSMKRIVVSPILAVALVVILVVGAVGIWYYRTTPGIGRPGPGEPGLADPILSGPNALMKGSRGGTGGSGTPASRPPGR